MSSQPRRLSSAGLLEVSGQGIPDCARACRVAVTVAFETALDDYRWNMPPVGEDLDEAAE